MSSVKEMLIEILDLTLLEFKMGTSQVVDILFRYEEL